MLGVQWIAEGELLRVAQLQVPAHLHTRVERLHAEVHRAVQVSQIWQLDPVHQHNCSEQNCGRYKTGARVLLDRRILFLSWLKEAEMRF